MMFSLFSPALDGRPRRRPLAALLAGLLVTATAQAAPDLPPISEVQTAIANAPMVAMAKSGLAAESANRDRLKAGPYEWATRLSSQRRHLSYPADQGGVHDTVTEWDVALERPLRLPNKATVDEALGEQGETAARIAMGDAQHETARQLLAAWFQWLRARVGAEQSRLQAKLLTQLADSTTRRQKLGDAARLETLQANAAAAQAEAQWRQAESRLQAASQDIRVRYPAISLPDTISLSRPEPMVGTLASWQDDIGRTNHQLALASAETRRAQLLAKRADADRIPDPLVGVHVGSEQGGKERVMGIYVAIPIAGDARRAAAVSQAARADAVAHQESGLRQQVSAEIARLHATANAAQIAWERADQAAQQLEASADLTTRAHRLGEAPLADVLMARRLAGDGRLAAEQTRLDALEARYRLELDAHRLWDYDAD